MLRRTLLLTLSGCLPAASTLAPLRPSDLSLRCEAEVRDDRFEVAGLPTARAGWQEQRQWRTLLLVSWRPAPSTDPVVAAFHDVRAPLLVDPGSFDDPAGSGLLTLPASDGATVQP